MTRLGQSPRSGRVKIRSVGANRASTGAITVPAHMARAVPDGAWFRAEWHEDGILFRFLDCASEPDDVAATPSWATEKNA